MNMSDTINALEHIFDELNTYYYEGKLPRPLITVQSTPACYGHCTTKRVWRDGDDENDNAMYEINIGAEHLNRPIEQTCATLNHEMVHLYCLVNDISDTCQNGRYHNKTFKKEAELRDLSIGYDRTIGWSITAPSEQFITFLQVRGLDQIRFNLARAVMFKAGTKKPRAKRVTFKYECPCCGTRVTAMHPTRLSCIECDEEMLAV